MRGIHWCVSGVTSSRLFLPVRSHETAPPQENNRQNKTKKPKRTNCSHPHCGGGGDSKNDDDDETKSQTSRSCNFELSSFCFSRRMKSTKSRVVSSVLAPPSCPPFEIQFLNFGFLSTVKVNCVGPLCTLLFRGFQHQNKRIPNKSLTDLVFLFLPLFLNLFDEAKETDSESFVSLMFLSIFTQMTPLPCTSFEAS